MKLSSTLLLQSLAFGTSIASRQALIYTIDTDSNLPQQLDTKDVSLETAQLILDRRLRTNMHPSLGAVDDDALFTLNRYGGRQRPMLENSADISDLPIKFLLAFEGCSSEAQEAGLSNLDVFPTLRSKDIKDENLYDEMAGEFFEKENPGRPFCSYARETELGLKVELHERRTTSSPCAPDSAVFGDHADLVYAILGFTPRRDSFLRLSYPKNPNVQIKNVLKHFHDRLSLSGAEGTIESTILVLPPQSQKSKKQTSSLASRRLPKEEPLAPFTDSSSDRPTTFASNTTIKLPPNTKIPRCFSSQSSCDYQTNNCSTHGQCILRHKPNEGDSVKISCWSCSCLATVTSDSGAVTHWGGNACQKMDISTPFWLFAGFGIFMSALVAGGIGMLWGMGSEELPSVLGAGVGGPRASR